MANKSPLEKMVNIHELKSTFKNKHVFLTGHTGFKGAWMLQILHYLGAKVYGYALSPMKKNDLYNQINGDTLCEKSTTNDIRNIDALQKEVLLCNPDFVIHMAAQPLVIESYKNPLYTYEVNTQGTANILEAIKMIAKPCVCLCITTDKVYENNELNTPFKENDKLGGYDPYSASKAAAEIVISSYRNSFFNNKDYTSHQKSIASVRAGNVIGGGDYADNRIIPDIVKAIQNDEKIVLRNPQAIRPWQHVLEPLFAYLQLAHSMYHSPTQYNEAFNIGPEQNDVLSVLELAQNAVNAYGKGIIEIDNHNQHLHEAHFLRLDIEKIKARIGWKPVYDAKTAIEKTIDWYKNTDDAYNKCISQIETYIQNMK